MISQSTWVISRADESKRVCYLIMPEGVKEDVSGYVSEAAQLFKCNMVILSGIDWNNDLTPWPAQGIFKQKKPFGGRAACFLRKLEDEYIPKIEAELGLRNPEKILVGISLSGLFSIWATTQTETFSAVASISGSLWYDSFSEWMSTQEVKNQHIRIHISIGNREKNSKEDRIKQVQDCTYEVVETLRKKRIQTDYQIIDGTHFSPIIPRLERALKYVLF